MPDLLTHVLLAYGVTTALSYRYTWIVPAYVTLAMVGTLVPDLDHVSTLIPSQTVETALGVPFDWGGLQTGGVVLLILLIGTVLVERGKRRRAFVMLTVGAAAHLFTDALIRVPEGRSQSVFFPVTMYQPPTPGLYLSTDLWPLVASALFALFAWYVVRRRADD
ncbi:metal-dependent hydrolase [Haloarcula halophila]|uniref:metal-dependent hydrolase n=1 Tax=Haloarcula TaxID=2237 RepID=UPI0023E3552E|nr:metal-dependent hydrolase [Halomicroarcula sp. DFY41]